MMKESLFYQKICGSLGGLQPKQKYLSLLKIPTLQLSFSPEFFKSHLYNVIYKLYPEVNKQHSNSNFELQHKSLVRLGGDVEQTTLFFFWS